MWPTIAILTLALAVAEAFVSIRLVRREMSKCRVAEQAAAENLARIEEIQELARLGNWEPRRGFSERFWTSRNGKEKRTSWLRRPRTIR
jgi:hypothetical protein